MSLTKPEAGSSPLCASPAVGRQEGCKLEAGLVHTVHTASLGNRNRRRLTIKREVVVWGCRGFIYLFRPNDAADEHQDMSTNESRNAADEAFRRRLIANLAEHILFSKYSSTLSAHAAHAQEQVLRT